MPKAGDHVKIITKDETFEGTILPRPDILSQDITVLKLTTGYNIGIESKNIKKIEVVESYKKKQGKPPALKKKKNLPTVAILSTGGTISSKIDYRTGGVAAEYTAADFVAMCPELADVANIEAGKLMEVMSEDMVPDDWVKIAKAISKWLPKVDGIVITQGTDTMHFTAAALSFLLKDLNKPIIITGAQRSIDRGSTDAFMNLICSVHAAARWDGAAVVTCMHGSMEDRFCDLVRGTKVRKMHTSRRDAFRAINDEPLARILPNGRIEVTNDAYEKRNDAKTSVRTLDADVALVYAYPGLDPSVIEHHVKKGAKGLVIAATALGHVASSGKQSLLPVLEKAAKKVPIVITTQTLYGRVHPYVYANLRKLSLDIKAFYAHDMLPEAAYAKLMVALKQKDWLQFMQENVAGEYTDRELDDSFLR